MEPSILVAYASVSGSTCQVAQAMGEVGAILVEGELL
jgi:hypothetical protein